MTIKEVEQKVGISKQNIRFYEKERLITPYHNQENGYREYSDKDVIQLNEIKLFRKLGISIADIMKMQQNEISIYDCMNKYAAIAKIKIGEMEEQEHFFDKIAQRISLGHELNAQEYLDDMETEERNGTKFFNIVFDFITKAQNYLGRGMENLIMKKGFDIELDEALTYPSDSKICEAIAKYCDQSLQESEFASRERPITFYLSGVLYSAKVGMARGGYILLCKEI